MRFFDQRDRDKNRKTYRLTFPSDLDAEQVTAWIRSISGTLRSTRTGIAGVPTVAFELVATSAGMQHRIKVPWQYADYIVTQMRSLVPGIRVTPEDEFATFYWTKAVEVSLTHSSRSLRIYDPAVTSASLLASMQALEAGEAVIMQWVVTPAVPEHPPSYNRSRSHQMDMHTLMDGAMASKDEVTDRRSKLVEPNVLGVLRVGAKANTNDRADHLIYKVRASLASTRSPATRFTKRVVSKRALQERIYKASGSLIFPIQLSARELTALVAWPLGQPNVVGLPSPLSRQIAAPQSVPLEGRIIGLSNMPGNERPIALSYADAVKHMHILGPSGGGKTTLLANMLKQDIEHGYGVILIESKGDLFYKALDYIPPERIQDVIVLDVTDRKWPVGFNILNQGDPAHVVDEIAGLFDYLYSDSTSVWTREVLFFGLSTLADKPGSTFVDLGTLLMPMTSEEVRWADEMRRTSSKDIRQFWQRFENQPRASQDRIVQPVMDRIWQLTARSDLKHIIGQSESTFQIADVIKDHKILLVNLEGVAKDTASLTGTLMMNAIWQAAKSNPTPDKPNFLYLDEFQSFINLPVDPEDMLAKARSYGLGMVLAHQHIAQLPQDIRSAVLNNARTKVVFQTAADDARTMAREFGSKVDETDFMHLGTFEALARVTVGGSVSSPLTLTTSAPMHGYGKAGQVRNISRGRYGRPLADVQAAMGSRTTTQSDANRRRPSIGSAGYSGE